MALSREKADMNDLDKFLARHKLDSLVKTRFEEVPAI